MVISAGDVFAQRLPIPIQQAQLRAQQFAEVHTIPQGPLLVGALLAFTNLDAVGEPLRFSRDRLARILGRTVRTVDRRLAELEASGLAERVTPKGRVRGRWAVCHLRWSAKALSVFWPSGIPARPAPPSPRLSRPAPAPAARTTLSHRSSGETKNYENKESGRAGFGHRPVPTPSPDRSRVPGLPPGPLPRLVTVHGLRREQVVTLMAHCKRRRQRLQDLLAVLGERLEGRRGDSLMGFLLHCAQLDRDWAAILKRRCQEARERAARNRRARNTARLVAGLPIGIWVPGLGEVIDQQGTSVVVQDSGVRRAAAGEVVVTALLAHGGWRALRAARRGRLGARPPAGARDPAVQSDQPARSTAGGEALRAALRLIKQRGLGIQDRAGAAAPSGT